MFKQKELPFQSVLMHLSVVRAWLHFLSVAGSKHVVPLDPCVHGSKLIFLLGVFLAFFPAYAILPSVNLSTENPEHLYQRVTRVHLV